MMKAFPLIEQHIELGAQPFAETSGPEGLQAAIRHVKKMSASRVYSQGRLSVFLLNPEIWIPELLQFLPVDRKFCVATFQTNSDWGKYEDRGLVQIFNPGEMNADFRRERPPGWVTRVAWHNETSQRLSKNVSARL